MTPTVRRLSAFLLALALASAAPARAGSGDLGPPAGVDAGDLALVLRMLAGLIAVDLEADVYPLGAPDGMLTADDAATVASAAVGAITIPGGGGSGDKLLFYAASLHAFDPATPETLLTVDAGNTHGGNFMPFGVLTADWSTAGPYPTAVNPRIPYVLYERAGAPEGDIDHRLFMVSTAKVGEGETPLPMQVASGHAGPICDFEIGLDFTDAMKTRLVFQAAGAGRDCDGADASEPWRFARLDTPETEAPLALPVGFFPITATLSDPATGAHHGWLGVQEEMEELTLVHYDPDFTTATPLKTGLLAQTGFGAPGITDELASTVDGKVFLNLDGGLYLYDIADEQAPGVGTLTAKLRDFSYKPLGAATGRPLAVGGDRAGGMYFLDTTPVRLYGVDGSGVVTPLATPDGAADFDQIVGGHTIVAADDRVVFTYRQPITVQRLASVKKDAAGLLELDSGLLVLLNTSGLGAGDTVFYTKTAAVDALPSAVAAPADGSGALVSREGANWIGFTASGAGLTTGSGVRADRAILVDGMSFEGMVAVQTGGTVRAVDATDFAQPERALGAVPEDIRFVLFGVGYEANRLGTGFTSTFKADVFRLNTETADSFARVHAATPDADEFPAALF